METETQEPLLGDGTDGKDKGKGKNVVPLLCSHLSSIAGLLFGYDQGMLSLLLVSPTFNAAFPGSASGYTKGLLTAILECGAFVGALAQSFISDSFSRRYSFLFAVAVFVTGAVIQTVAQGYVSLLIGRAVGGTGVGMLSMVAPVYISEIAPREKRGSMLALQELSVVLGILLAFAVTLWTTCRWESRWQWKLPFALQLVPALCLAVGVLYLPFSPRWLAMKGRLDEVKLTLCRLRGLPADDERLREELEAIVDEAARAKNIELAWKDLFVSFRKRTAVATGLMFFQQFVGINALVYYSPTLFAMLGLDDTWVLCSSGVLNALQLVGVLSSLWTMDRFGRRPLLLVGSAVMFFCHVGVAGGPAALGVVLLFIYMVAFGAGWGPVPWAMPSEIFPSPLRAKGVAIATCSNWWNNFVVGLITPPLMESSAGAAYLFFATFCLLSGIWAWFCVPETNGKTLEEVDLEFSI
ncbi:general substrate transporter [Piedraia hortae CBS 480.64]|uniref:General substrate transporter n=1 Tax=Piedraia hortae CBS 480.64 TaxID=1314780 RepID=A0A6A7CCM1_9PEZI|nr:general substrate transporter [Piedraia hortae CBS 480.64]